MQKAILFSEKQDEPIGYLTFQFDNKFIFEAFTVTAWGGVTEIIESNFFTEGYIKWDGCSHINFHGQDYVTPEFPSDAYYHICGGSDWINHVLMMCFIFEVARQQFIKHGKYIDDDFEMVKKLGLLEGYTIEYVEVD